MLTREQKEVPPIGESVKRIVGSISKLADTAVKSAETLKKMREEMIIKDRVIAKQQAEIENKDKVIGVSLEEIKRLRNMVEIVLYHHPKVDDPIDWESAYYDLKDQVTTEYEKNPWIEVPNAES